MTEGTHIHAVRLADPDDSRSCALRIEIFPLPNDEQLLRELYAGIREMVNVQLTAAGIASGEMTEIPTAGTKQ